jgi:DUF2075 family protein
MQHQSSYETMKVVDSWDMDLPDKYTNWVDTCNPMLINVVSIYVYISHGFMRDLIHDFIILFLH